MMPFVVDASVAIKWVLKEEGDEHARQLAGAQLQAPDLIQIECGNILWKRFIRRELSSQDVTERLETLRAAPLRLVSSIALMQSALQIALALGHPVYDCLYLALAVEQRTSLITADRRLLRVVENHREYKGFVQPLGL